MPIANFVFQQGGSECISTLDVALDAITEADALDALQIFWAQTWGEFQAVQCVLEEIRLGDAVLSVGLPGGGETNALPANCALILQKNTSTNVRGRMFLPGLSEADTDAGGRVGAELRGLLNTACETERAILITAGVTPQVVSRVGGGETAYSITSFQARPLVATLRNRVVTR